MSGYCYVWTYTVRPDCIEEFINAYGSDGEWVRLFRRAPGYVRTELCRERRSPDRFMTIDHWESAEAWEAFRRDFATDFESLDARCESLTIAEREIGRFDPA